MSAVGGAAGAAPPVATGSFKRRSLLILLGALTTVGIAWYGHQYWTVGRFIEDTDDAYVGGDVTVIAPRVAGFVTRVAVTDNQPVHAGDLLVKLDDRDYRAALAKEDAAVDASYADLANLDATRRVQQATIQEAQAGIDAADAEITRSHLDQGRYRLLSAGAAASIQAFQKADADYKTAVAAGSKARAALDAARQQLAVIDTRKAQIAAALAGAQASQQAAALNLGYTELRAPIDGVIGNRSAQLGAFAAVGAHPARRRWRRAGPAAPGLVGHGRCRYARPRRTLSAKPARHLESQRRLAIGAYPMPRRR